jgi:molecular chaperone GrpE
MQEGEKDEILEEFVDEDEAEATPAALKKLREKLNKAVKEKQEYLYGWQRARADFANFKREEAAHQAEKEEYIKRDLIEKILPVLDTLELSMRHEENPAVARIEKQFLDALARLGIKKFGAKGEKFDPHIHEALAERGDQQIIESVERSGYSIGDKIIRAAQVIIH